MTGITEAEAIIGLVSAIISIIDAAKKVYDATQDANGLPEAFREVAQRLPLVENTLLTVKRDVDAGHWDGNRSAAVKKTLESCQTKSAKLEKIFKDVIPGDTASRFDRYVAAARKLGKGSRVETLMKGILDDLSLVAGKQVAGLSEAIMAISKLKPSLTSEQLPEQDVAYSHSGSGHINHVEGNQYNNHGSGKQYNFETVTTLNLGKD
ncbi:hypothetical protein N431DRAFT_436474 [Stipitochalara longipes BDJ]|nr:hypothetical protein N431DRAFT_436474 [Stipitochalara longipes BDJ]